MSAPSRASRFASLLEPKRRAEDARAGPQPVETTDRIPAAETRTIVVDVLHPALALSLLRRAPRAGRVLYAFRTAGLATTLLIRLLDRRTAGCARYDYTVASPDGSNRSLYHPIQAKVLAVARGARDRLLEGAVFPAAEPLAARRRFADVVLNQAILEVVLPVQLAAVAARDFPAGAELWLEETRIDPVLERGDWPAGIEVRRHRAGLIRRIAARPEYMCAPLRRRLSDLVPARLAMTAVLSLYGLAADALSRLLPRARPAARPVAAFLTAADFGPHATGMDWLAGSGFGAVAIVPPGEASRLDGDPRFAEVVEVDLSRRILRTRLRHWRGYANWLRRLVALRPAWSRALPANLRGWLTSAWLDLKRREAFFGVLFEERGVRLSWLMCEFNIDATAQAMAVLRRGGECWSGMYSRYDRVDRFAFRANCSRLFAWTEAEAAIGRAAGIEAAEAAGYPADLDRARAEGAELRRRLLAEGAKRIIALYDNRYLADLMLVERDVVALYEAVLRARDAVPGTYLIVKSKGLDVFASSRLGEIRRGLEADPRVAIEYTRGNLAPAFAADIVVGIMLSGPALVAALSGRRAVCLDPAGYAGLEHAPRLETFRFVASARELEHAVADAVAGGADGAGPAPGDAPAQKIRFDAHVASRVRQYLADAR